MGYSKDVYSKIIERKLNHNSQKRPKSWKQLQNGKVTGIGCGHAVSIYLQRKGCLDPGQLISHTTKSNHNKNSKKKAIWHYERLKNCKFKYMNKLYKDVPDKYKKAGNVFVYNSDIGVCQGKANGIIYSCNNDGVQTWKNVTHKDGSYQHTHKILWIIIPK